MGFGNKRNEEKEMTVNEIKERLYKLYDRAWIDKWMERKIPFLPYNGKSPLEIFELAQHDPRVTNFVNSLLYDLES